MDLETASSCSSGAYSGFYFSSGEVKCPSPLKTASFVGQVLSDAGTVVVLRSRI